MHVAQDLTHMGWNAHAQKKVYPNRLKFAMATALWHAVKLNRKFENR